MSKYRMRIRSRPKAAEAFYNAGMAQAALADIYRLI